MAAQICLSVLDSSHETYSHKANSEPIGTVRELLTRAVSLDDKVGSGGQNGVGSEEAQQDLIGSNNLGVGSISDTRSNPDRHAKADNLDR